MRAYFDADILIAHLRGEHKAFECLSRIKFEGEYELWIGALQRAEVIFFMRPEEEKQTAAFLSEFRTAPVDQVVIDKAAALYRKWNPSHGVDINDTILAATAMQTGGKILTFNLKHYPMPDVIVERAG